MDNRLLGLVIATIALLFLWMYDTGRWSAFVQVLQGVNPAAATGGGGGLLGGLLGAGGGALPALPGVPSLNFGSLPASSGGSGAGWQQALCSEWPVACPYAAAASGVKTLWNDTLGKILPIRL